MKAELTKEGLVLTAQCRADEDLLDRIYAAGHLHLVAKARTRPTKRWGYKTRRGNVLLQPSLAAWEMVPYGKKHGTGDARTTNVRA